LAHEPAADAALLARYHAGDAAAFDELYARHKDALYHHARALTRDDGLAEDLLNESFLELARQGDAARSASSSLAPFLHTVLRRRAADRRRSDQSTRRREAGFSQQWVRERSDGVDPSQLADLNRALGLLPTEQAEAVVLHAYAGLTFQEAADVLDASINTVASRYRAALKRLAELMNEGSRA